LTISIAFRRWRRRRKKLSAGAAPTG